MILGSGGPPAKGQGDGGGNELRLLLLVAVAAFGWKLWQRYQPLIHKLEPYYDATVRALPVLATAALIPALAYLWNWIVRKIAYPRSVTAKGENTVCLGRDDKGQVLHLKQSTRTVHAQVIGTTMAGKTESIVLPWAVHDVEHGASVIIVDGKGDKDLLERFYSHVVRAKRVDDFQLISIGQPERSHTFNPLLGGDPHTIAERLFSCLKFEEGYYKNLQFQILGSVLELLGKDEEPVTFVRLMEALSLPENLRRRIENAGYQPALIPLQNFLGKDDERWHEKVSGLVSQLSTFTVGGMAERLNASKSEVDLQRLLSKPGILYCQLPTMHSPILAPALGRMILQILQQAISQRHQSCGPKTPNHFFSVILDDFQDFVFPEFGSILNKARSANVGVVFSHQSLGDLDKVSKEFRNIVTTNTNIKVIMRTNDPDTCEHFARTFGTRTGTKVTDRRQAGMFGDTLTGEGSLREVEEYRVHPNVIKQLSLGQGVVTIPHAKGVEVRTVQFCPLPPIARLSPPLHSIPELAPALKTAHKPQCKTAENKSSLVG